MLDLGMKRVLVIAMGASLALGCGDEEPDDTAGTSEGTTGGGTESTTSMSTTESTTSDTTTMTSASSATTDSTTTSATDPTTETATESSTGGGACETEIAALAPDVTDASGGCSVTIRLDYESLDIIGWSAQCDATGGTALDEEGARALTSCCGAVGDRLGPDDPSFFLFAVPPADDGDVALVSNHLQSLVFEGTVIYNGDGAIGFPTANEDPVELASGCAVTEIPKVFTFDPTNDGNPLDKDDAAEILDVIQTTALPAAMGSVNELQRAAIVLYSPRIPLAPNDAEFIVVVEAG
jgi:hypothetical protein